MSDNYEISDRELVLSTLAGDRQSYGQLVERHQDAVYNVAYRMACSNAEAADATQEAFVRAYQKIRQFDPDKSFRNWVMSICVNRLKNRFRSFSRQRSTEESYLTQTEVDATADPRVAAVEEVLNDMPDKLRMPLVLKYIEGMKHSEIGNVLKISVSASKMRTKRALEELTARLSESGGGV